LQGTASVVLAGLVAALKLVGGTLAEHTFLFLGAGEVSLSYLFHISIFCFVNSLECFLSGFTFGGVKTIV